MPLMLMDHVEDPKDVLRTKIGDISEFDIAANQVLIAIYKRPERTAGGILLTDETRGEDKHQGKVGLVLKMGPSAFIDDDKYRFRGFVPTVGDWVVFKVSDGWPLSLNSREGHCRLLDDTDIRCRTPRPDMVW